MIGETKQAEYLISSGKRGTPTPSGVFYIKNKIPLAQSRLFPGIWMEKWNALARTPDGGGYQGYGVHRVPCFDPNCNSREPASHLGRPVSHGCVRIENAGADWVYDNAPVGTPVNIHI
jgi:lipoprotein-anchoring transpeptidase ErfK/SrfK